MPDTSPAPSASAPSASTKSMSPDRGALGKIVGHLFMAAKILLEGRVSGMEEVRHEIRIVMADTVTATDSDTSTSTSTVPEGETTSVVDWKKRITRLLHVIRRLPDSVGSVPENLKKDLARLIKQGKNLCSGGNGAAEDAQQQLLKAIKLYRKLSGVSYV
jgi:hypothetical protein